MIGQAIGGMQAMGMMVVSYYFGTTKGSEDKNSNVSDALSKVPTPLQTTVSAIVTTPEGVKS